jgi:hypothetical protein
MKMSTAALVVFAGIVLLLALPAQNTGSVVGWYNGDWQSGIPGAPNWYLNADEFARIYDQFQVPSGGWTIVSVFSNNYISDAANVASVSWEIRRGMTPGNGGELVASGLSPAIQSPDPSVSTPRYPEPVAKTRFRIQANFLHVQLPAGSYWLSVTPAGVKTSTASPTLGSNAVGLDANGPRLAVVDRTAGPRYAIAEALGRTGQVGRARQYSQGVIVAK